MATEATETNKIRAWVALVGMLVLLLAVGFMAREEMSQIRQFIVRSGWEGRVLTVLIYPVLGATPIPTEPLTLLSSTIYGPFFAMLAAVLGNLLSALVEYFIGRQIRDATAFEHRRERLPFHLGKFPVDSPAFLIGSRMLIGYVSKFVNLTAGMYKVPMWRFIWTTVVSTVPGTALLAYGGLGLLRLLF